MLLEVFRDEAVKKEREDVTRQRQEILNKQQELGELQKVWDEQMREINQLLIGELADKPERNLALIDEER